MVGNIPQLLGKTAIVSGTGEAIGASVAQVLADHGARIHAIGKKYDDILSRVGPERVESGAVTPVAVSESDSGALRSAINSIGYREILDILVCATADNWCARAGNKCTGVEVTEQIVHMTDAIRSMLEISLPFLRASRGTVVLIGAPPPSLGVSEGDAEYYRTSNALSAFGHETCLRERDRGVRVTTVLPGFTFATARGNETGSTVDSRSWMLKPEDVAQACLFVVTLPARALVPELSIVPARLPDGGASFNAPDKESLGSS